MLGDLGLRLSPAGLCITHRCYVFGNFPEGERPQIDGEGHAEAARVFFHRFLLFFRPVNVCHSLSLAVHFGFPSPLHHHGVSLGGEEYLIKIFEVFTKYLKYPRMSTSERRRCWKHSRRSNQIQKVFFEMAANNSKSLLILQRELAYGEITRQSIERREYRESFIAFPEVPAEVSYSTLSIETVPWSNVELVLRITIGGECHTRSVSLLDLPLVQDYAQHFKRVDWSKNLLVIGVNAFTAGAECQTQITPRVHRPAYVEAN